MDFGRLLASNQFTDINFLVGGDPGVVVAAHIALVAARSDWLRSRNREAKAGRDANSSSATLGRGNMLPKIRKRYRIFKAENGWKMKNLEHFFS